MIVTNRWLRIKFWFFVKILRRPHVSFYTYHYATQLHPDTQIRLHEEVK